MIGSDSIFVFVSGLTVRSFISVSFVVSFGFASIFLLRRVAADLYTSSSV